MVRRDKTLLQNVALDVTQRSKKSRKGVPEHANPRTPNQALYVRTIRENSMVWSVGPAGSGKTRLAVASAVEAFQQGEVRKIIISRPAVGSEDLGAVPGTIEDKVAHYLEPVVEFLKEFMGPSGYNAAKENKKLEFVAVGHMRGRNLNHAFVIVDEAQNATFHQLKTVVTRIGEGSKMVITGDPTQSDLPTKLQDGYPNILKETVSVIAEANKTKTNLGVSFAILDKGDILRHKIVQAYVTQFEKSDNSRNMTGLIEQIKEVQFAQQQIIFDDHPSGAVRQGPNSSAHKLAPGSYKFN